MSVTDGLLMMSTTISAAPTTTPPLAPNSGAAPADPEVKVPKVKAIAPMVLLLFLPPLFAVSLTTTNMFNAWLQTILNTLFMVNPFIFVVDYYSRPFFESAFIPMKSITNICNRLH
ncbi:MAG: hypothetical protein OFPI_40970 [Osedax symbiont Rs2]|nr:MAG: hypothetical protein OFPI_40970 [Osedax symbiont Rs2]